jgi:hypothetical protein
MLVTMFVTAFVTMFVTRAVPVSLLIFLSTISAPVFSVKPLTSVADLRYGVVLYNYYQDQYFDALSELMVAQAQGGIKGHGDNPQLMKGGISLAFGMERNAGEIFTHLLEENRPAEIRNTAWFYLGKLRYLRGDWQGASASLHNISGVFEQKLLPELTSLQFNLLLQQDQLHSAEQLLESVTERNFSVWMPYLYYNLGAAYSRKGDFKAAISHYAVLNDLKLMQAEQVDEDVLALNDRSLTAAGYSQMLSGDLQKALTHFSNVRLNSPQSNRALLGYGWAAAEMGEYALALKPWQELSRRSLVYAPVQEALLAVPYAYEKLGAAGEALNAYLAAETVFKNEILRIDKVLSGLQDQALLKALSITEESNRNWFSIETSTEINPQLSYLTELFASNEFQGGVQELRDLVRLQKLLLAWNEKLEIYSAMLHQRQQSREKKLANIRQRRMLERGAELTVARDKLAQRLSAIESSKDYLAIASEDTLSLYKMVNRAEENIDKLKASGESVAEYEGPLRRYRGLLLWQASEDFADHLWQNQRELNALNEAVQVLQKQQTSLQVVIDEAPDVAPFRSRVNTMKVRVRRQLQDVDTTIARSESSLREKVVQSLQQQKARLQHYIAETRLSTARLYDSAQQESQQ